MGLSQNEAKMEGWLYTIRSNPLGLQFSRKRYFVLHNHVLRSFKANPISEKQEPVRSAVIDSCIRVIDNGKESINKKVFFIFTVYSILDGNNQIKLGASSSEEAAAWIRCLKDVALEEPPPCQAKNFVGSPTMTWPSLRSESTWMKLRKNSVKWPFRSSVHAEATTSDVIAPSHWKIFGCQNGLRLFKEAKDRGSLGGLWDDDPAIMAVGVVDGTSEAIFLALMSLGPSRSEWDYCVYHGSLVECLDGHTDIIHKKLYSDWLPWGMKRRDLLLQRYWRREDDGTYVILYHSVAHKKCPPQSGYVRAHLKSNACSRIRIYKSSFSCGGGYVVTPVNQGQQSTVKHMLAIDWKLWKSYPRLSAARSLTILMLMRVAALRELFKAKQRNSSSICLSREWLRHIHLPQTEKPDDKTDTESDKSIEDNNLINNEVEQPASLHVSLSGLNEEPDEFFDVPEESEFSDYDHLESERPGEPSSELPPLNLHQPKLTSAASFVRKLHDLATQKKGYMNLQEVATEDTKLYCYGNSLRKDLTATLPSSWSPGNPSLFLIRGRNYLQDKQKIKANGALMQMVGADWLISEKREDNLGSRLGGIVQNHAAQGGPEFFFIVNFQIPGTPRYTLAMYFMMKSPLEDHPSLYKFVNGDDAYRNSRFKLIPHVSEGSWIVKQSVGKRGSLLCQTLEAQYFRGKNYMEVDVDVASSTVARSVCNLVIGYFSSMVLELAFVIQGNTREELPETLLGTSRLNRVDLSKALVALP
ncbi:protein ENHANCED DISEASE RESISTANCE 2-like isoform X1 [Gossypium arboreum]|uniref:protein ENHANCED DISEASE RESISTANCE 2-like isoform X1 n=2 Tax=Gossypium arboreum TaxID=29729 RepID=UPI0022F16145|nr:protein ENHANCED DISEASE RESISTANCE 2-like isoform X1 [Gossypium arboreum]